MIGKYWFVIFVKLSGVGVCKIDMQIVETSAVTNTDIYRIGKKYIEYIESGRKMKAE